MKRPAAKVIGLWIAAAVVAAGGATAAVAMTSDGTDVLSEKEISQRVNQGVDLVLTSDGALVQATPRPGGPHSDELEIDDTPAGTVFISCRGGKTANFRTVLKPGWSLTKAAATTAGTTLTFGHAKEGAAKVGWECVGDMLEAIHISPTTK